MTPYQIHATLNHQPMSRYSPNAVDIIEECDCGQRFLHNPSIGYPVTLPFKEPTPFCTCGHREIVHTRVFTLKGCNVDVCACEDFQLPD